MALELKQSFKDTLTEENNKMISSLTKTFEELNFTSDLDTLNFSKTALYVWIFWLRLTQ